MMALGPVRPCEVIWTVDVATLEKARILRGWTQRRLALESHVDRDLVLGRRRPTLGTIQALCYALDLTLADVIIFEEPRKAPG